MSPKVITAILLFLLASGEAPAQDEPLRLGDTRTIDIEGCSFSLKMIPQTPEGFWNQYLLQIEMHNGSTEILRIDRSTIFLVDEKGLTVFSMLDDIEMLAANIRRLDALMGRTTTAELRQIRQAVESSADKTRTPSEGVIPPACHYTLSTMFHTPRDPESMTLTIGGVQLGDAPLKLRPLLIRVPQQ